MPHYPDSNDSLALYFEALDRLPAGLSRAEEAALSRRIQGGDEAARQQLAEANLRFVVTVAKKYQNCGLDLPDLIAVGNLGLMTAVDRFDGAQGWKFISYAVWWIKQAILQAVAEQSRTIRLPMNRISRLTQINAAQQALRERLTRAPTVDELASEVELDPDDLERLLLIAIAPASLEAPQYDDLGDAGPSFAQILPDDGPAPDETSDRANRAAAVAEILAVCTERETEIITRYFGLDGEPPETLEQIAARYRITRERVRQIKARALDVVQHRLRRGRLPLAAAVGAELS